MRTQFCTAFAAVLLTASALAHAQTTGSQGSNQGTPMQQAPAGMPSGVNASPLSDREFVAAAAIANRFEIEAGKLALAQASDARLKEFARMMVTDHTAALEELEAAAKEAGVPVPASPALDQPHGAKLAALKARKADFDQAYRGDQMQAHREAVTMLESYLRTGTREPLRIWAAKTLPVVKKHLEVLTVANEK